MILLLLVTVYSEVNILMQILRIHNAYAMMSKGSPCSSQGKGDICPLCVAIVSNKQTLPLKTVLDECQPNYPSATLT